MTQHCVPTATLPGSHQAAALSLVDRAKAEGIALSNRQLRVSRDGSHPDIVGFTTAFLKDLKSRGMPFFPNELLRSGELQDDLYQQGVTRARAGQSPHNWGMAVDIVHFGRYWALSDKEWAVIGLLGKEVARRRNLKVTWGGDWSFYDPAHWELADWKQRITQNIPETFKEAFRKARSSGLSMFHWKGREYSTDLA